jgi:hypothetical protein
VEDIGSDPIKLVSSPLVQNSSGAKVVLACALDLGAQMTRFGLLSEKTSPDSPLANANADVQAPGSKLPIALPLSKIAALAQMLS